ncbi:hypothetical protein EDB85DRAFT_1428921 [Lactarius pseudohatsudake]|nr:hypothetical protein EDB85DRAFT_1428921 [Lactarius pseudohatsudake]
MSRYYLTEAPPSRVQALGVLFRMPRPNPVFLYSNFRLALNLESVVTDSRNMLYLEFPRERRRWKEYLPVATVRSATLAGSKHGGPTYLEPSYCEIISVVVVTPISPRALFSATSYAPTSGAISELGLLLALHEAPRHAASGQGTPTVLRIAWFVRGTPTWGSGRLRFRLVRKLTRRCDIGRLTLSLLSPPVLMRRSQSYVNGLSRSFIYVSVSVGNVEDAIELCCNACQP